MKSLLSAVLLSLVFAACASKKATETPVATAPVAQPAPMTKAEAKKAKAKAAKEAKAAAAKPESAATTAASDVATSSSEATCKTAADERKLAIVPKESGCELHYTKSGQTSTIASQVVGNVKCESVMTSVKEKLIDSGYSCQ